MTAEEALLKILKIAKEHHWEKLDATEPRGKVWAFAHTATVTVPDAVTFYCRLDEMQCSEECHGNLEKKRKCQFCTVLST